MKRIALLLGVCLWMAQPACMGAQQTVTDNPGPNSTDSHDNQVTAGVFADYFRFNPAGTPTTNYVGAGGRFGFAYHHIGLEGEMSYDFARNITTSTTTTSGTTTTTTFTETRVRPLTGLFGPKFDFGPGHFHAFVTGKVGFIDFTTGSVVNGQTFSNAVNGVGNAGTHIAMYPGGGIEGFWGPIGLRAEAGDEVYLNNGTFNNIRATIGPEIRF